MKKLFGLLFILFGFLIIWKMFLPNLHFGNWTAGNGQQSISAPVSGVSTIAIKGKAATVHIVSGKQSHLTAEVKGNGDLTINKTGNEVKLEVHNRWVDWVPVGKQTTLYVYIPESYSQSLKLDLTAGNVEINGKSIENPLNLNKLSLKMSAGNVQVSNVHAKKFQENGSAGDVHLDRLTTQSSEMKLSAGNVELTHFIGALHLNLSAGQVHAQLDQLKGSVDMSVSAGNITLELPQHASVAVDSQVTEGSVTCNLPLDKTSVDEDHHIQGVQGSGKYHVDLKASIGDIHMN